jgi:cation:H+ antiporter
MLLAVCYMILGLVGLVWAGDRFVTGASAFARNLGVPTILIGLTIVALGTSAPEIVVAISASLRGSSGIALGNAIGSNIANIGLVIGLTALIKPLEINSKTLEREFPILFVVVLIAGFFIWGGELTRLEGCILLLGMVVLITWIIWLGLHKRGSDPLVEEYSAEIPVTMKTRVAVFWLVIGCIFLPLSSELFVEGAVDFATLLGIPEVIIGLTIVAVGTSLPELAASVMGVLKNEPDIALGNILGSNMFNLLAVLGIPGVIHPFQFGMEVFYRDYLVMFMLTALLYAFSHIGKKNNGCYINRGDGFVLLAVYCVYIVLISAGIVA